jgi:DNA-directed RNA polymerase specialized sigma24 family protein
MSDTGQASGAPESPDGSASGARSRWGGQRRGAGTTADAAVRQALDALYQEHYRSLVRLAALLTCDALLAEEVAADSLLALISGPLGICLQKRAQFCLRQQVVARCRRITTVHRTPAAEQSTGQEPDGRDPISGWAASPVVHLLESLPASQREAVVLRHYLDLTEKETAALMGASLRAVRRSLTSAGEALQAVRPDDPEAGQA